jgi:hypothetical protein
MKTTIVGELRTLSELVTSNEIQFNPDNYTHFFFLPSEILIFFYRFFSTNDPEKLISLDEYISRMKSD